MLNITKLNQYYGESHTLWDFSLDIPEGSCTCLMGRNGVGKTTLLKSIMGVLPIQSGFIEYRGTNLVKQSAAMRARQGIGYVPQGRDIFPQMSVEENLQIGLFARADKATEIPETVFELFPGLKQMLKRRGGDLSGGQQQQLAIGRALAINPSLLILDEPEEGIQPNIVQQIADVINHLNTEGMTVLVTSQKIPFIRKVGKHFAMMDRGRIVGSGKISTLTEEMVSKHLAV